MPGTSNVADSLTKFVKEPLNVVNSAAYREGPALLTSGNILAGVQTFLEVSKGVYTPIGSNIGKGVKNVIDLQKEHDEIFGNVIHPQVHHMDTLSSQPPFPETSVNLFDENYACFLTGTLEKEFYLKISNFVLLK